MTDAEVDHVRLAEHLAEFLRLRQALVLEMTAAFPHSFSQSPVGRPRAGEFVMRGERWGFGRHGSGFEFKRQGDGVVVDVCKWPVADALSLDAWSACIFLTSRQWQFPHGSSTLDWTRTTLEQLCAAGVLERTDARGFKFRDLPASHPL